MAINNLNDIINAYNGRYPTSVFWNSITSVASLPYSLWTATGMPGAGSVPATGSGAALSSATTGAIPLPTLSSGQSLYLFNIALNVTGGSGFMLYDKLVATSGLSGTVTTAQTINSTALPRYTDGNGVELWLEWYSATGATARTASISYTNQDGTSGRTATATIAASTPANRMVRATLQAGDTGVQSVQSLTILVGTTGTAGNFGISLMRKIITVPVSSTNPVVLSPLELGLVKLSEYGASQPCLTPVFLPSTTTTGLIFCDIIFGVS